MDRKVIVLIISLFILLVVGMFVFSFMKRAEIVSQDEQTNTAQPNEVLYPSIDRIDGTHYYFDGMHTVVGEIPLPTPCDLLETSATVSGDQVQLQFSVINTSETCIQQLTSQRYKVEAEAEEDVEFSAIFMGRDVVLNLRPAPEGERPEEFELFIKG